MSDRLNLTVLAVLATALAGCTTSTNGSPTTAPSAPTASSNSPTRTTTAVDPRFANFSPCPADELPIANGNRQAGWLCSSLDVPLDRAQPDGAKLPIAIYALPHGDSGPSAEPVFSTPGGPGDQGFGDAVVLMVPQLHAHHDIVIIDPRGTGHSGAIDCPDLQKTSSAPNVARAFVGACGASLGAAADRYGAADRVTDLDDVRQRLGYDSIDYYGPSAGSWDAQAYAHRFHQHLHAVVLDSGFPTTATPPDYNDFWFTGAPAELLRVVALSCARDANCHGRDPDPTSTLTKLAEQLRRTPISTLDESGLVALILDADPVGVVEAADDARSGTTDPIIRLLADTRGGDKRSIANYSAGDNAAGICNDVDTPWSRTDSPAVRRKKIDAALATMPVDAYAPFSKEAWTDNEAWDFCVDWPAPTRYEPVVPPGAPPVSTPALVLSGELDRQVPSFSSRTLLQQFTKATFLIVNDAQHVTVAGPGTCAADIVAQFFDTLDAGSPTCAVPG